MRERGFLGVGGDEVREKVSHVTVSGGSGDGGSEKLS